MKNLRNPKAQRSNSVGARSPGLSIRWKAMLLTGHHSLTVDLRQVVVMLLCGFTKLLMKHVALLSKKLRLVCKLTKAQLRISSGLHTKRTCLRLAVSTRRLRYGTWELPNRNLKFHGSLMTATLTQSAGILKMSTYWLQEMIRVSSRFGIWEL